MCSERINKLGSLLTPIELFMPVNFHLGIAIYFVSYLISTIRRNSHEPSSLKTDTSHKPGQYVLRIDSTSQESLAI